METNKEVKITEYNHQEKAEVNREGIKKIAIFVLMGIAFVGCMYLIFKPDDKIKEIAGLNESVPQASEATLEDNKLKAYELEGQTKQENQKRDMLKSLSEYWSEDSKAESESEPPSQSNIRSSYNTSQRELMSFYKEEDTENQRLKQEVEEMKRQLSEKESKVDNDIDKQLEIMEKSYQMAAKYLPVKAEEATPKSKAEPTTDIKAKEVFSVQKSGYEIQSSLSPPSSGYTFNIVEGALQHDISKNSIRAVIHQDQTIMSEMPVRIRLLEKAVVKGFELSEGSVISAFARIQGGRLLLSVSSIEVDGSIILVNLNVYDLDGQPGLNAQNSLEVRAMSEIAANMSQNTGTTLMMTQSAKQQVAADLSRGAIQGVSGYFSRKARTPKVSVKAGHQVFLVSK